MKKPMSKCPIKRRVPSSVRLFPHQMPPWATGNCQFISAQWTWTWEPIAEQRRVEIWDKNVPYQSKVNHKNLVRVSRSQFRFLSFVGRTGLLLEDGVDGPGRIVPPCISLEIDPGAAATAFWHSIWAIKSLSSASSFSIFSSFNLSAACSLSWTFRTLSFHISWFFTRLALMSSRKLFSSRHLSSFACNFWSFIMLTAFEVAAEISFSFSSLTSDRSDS